MKGADFMGNNSENKPDRYINIGIVAHVDAGKTTLSESMLYHAGAIRKLGRVDHKDAFLDTDQMERERGITIFSKQAVFRWKDRTITLLDTPGHVDFSAEMERVLQVLDCAVLVVSGADGVQGHTQTLWKLLKRYHIPTFLFVNKMDQEGTDGEKLLKELRKRFGENVVPFVDIMTESDCPGGKVYLHTKESAVEEVLEELAVCEDDMMEEYLEEGRISLDKVQKAVADRQVFPCYFGSALHSQGVEELLDGLDLYIKDKTYPAEFGAKVYKIARDNQGNRLTYLKVTGGRLKVKDVVEGLNEKINQIRIYSGEKFEAVQEVEAGRVCAVTGLENTRPGQGIGAEEESDLPVLEPVLTYQILLPDDCDVHKMLLNLKILEEEEPELHIVWEEQTSEIHVQLMGDVQIEILQRMIKERFGVLVEFGEGSIVYKETITALVEGVGHFEPLRHYAEVHLRLEPYYEFRMELPSENVGRAMTDIQNMSGKFGTPMIEEETTVLTGSAPVSLMRGYQKEFTAYTGGRGRIAVSLKGYDICHNQEEVLAESTYDSEADLANPTGSVFCAHGAGFVVDCDEVEEYMHMEHTLESGNDDEMDIMEVTLPKRRHSSIELTQEELDAIYVRTPDPKKTRSTGPVTVRAKEKTREPGSAYQDPKWEARRRAKAGTEEYLLVDGYNIIFSWEELKELSERDIGAARGKLADILSNYQGFRKCTLILVYDAYKVEGNPGEVMKYHNIYIVYTKEAETADQYIEKTVRRIAKNADVTVATSDGLEQVIIMGQGAHRMSAPGLKEEVELALKELRGEHLGRQVNLKNYLLDYLDEETAKQMEEIRLGKEKC